MAETPRYPEPGRPGAGSTTGAPRWAKVFSIVALIVALLFLVLFLTRGPGGGHGPGQHTSSKGAAPDRAALVRVTGPDTQTRALPGGSQA